MTFAKRLLPAMLLILLAAGCFPVELSASKDGKILVPREEGFCIIDTVAAEPAASIVCPPTGKDKPAFGIFAPDAKSFLAISSGKGKGMGPGFKIQSVTVADGKARDLATVESLLYAQLSPDGKIASLARSSGKENPTLKETMPEVVLLSVPDGGTKKLASDVGLIHRWFPDSKALLVLHVLAKDEDSNQYTAELVKMDGPTGKATTLAAVLGTKKVFFDLSPDGTKALIVALKVDKPGTKLPASSKDGTKLFEVDLATGAAKAVTDEVAYAVYSPEGTRVLIAGSDETDDKITLAVADASFKKITPVATDAAKTAGENNAEIYAGWIDENTVHYIALRTVFGIAAKNWHLTTVTADGKTRKDLQPILDVVK